jgi:hypothetical protein
VDRGWIKTTSAVRDLEENQVVGLGYPHAGRFAAAVALHVRQPFLNDPERGGSQRSGEIEVLRYARERYLESMVHGVFPDQVFDGGH